MQKTLLAVGVFLAHFSVTFAQDSSKAPKVPFEGIETNWQNGSDRRDSSVFSNKYFNPMVMIDVSYTHSFNHPNDNTVVGSTALARDNEMQLSQLSLGGEMFYENARAKVLLQFGTRSEVVPRNDLSPYRGQYKLADVYRFLSET